MFSHKSCLTLKSVSIYLQREESTQTEVAHTFMIPFQLSPVDTLKRVRKAMPKLVKVACRLRPSQGFSSLQSAGESSRSTSVKPRLPVLIQSSPPNLAVRPWNMSHRYMASGRTAKWWSHGGLQLLKGSYRDRVAKLFSVEADDLMDSNTLWLRRSRLDIRKVVFIWRAQ